MRKLIFEICILQTLISLVVSECSMTQTSFNNAPEPTNSTNNQPKARDWGGATVACPEFLNQPSCCNELQNQNLNNNFVVLSTTFGNGNGGCDFCVANLVRFWCYFTCSPNQADFLQVGNLFNTTLPGEQNLTAIRNVTLEINGNMACDIYSSCEKTAIITEISSAQSAFGLFNFLGTNGEAQGLVYINVELTDSDGAMLFSSPVHECNETNTTDPNGYNIPAVCSCASCQQLCGSVDYVTYGSITDGFSLSGVAIVYIIAAGLTVGSILYQVLKKKNSRRSNVRPLLQKNE